MEFTPEQIQQIRKVIHDEFQEFLASDRYIFHKTLQLLDGRNIILGKGNGTKFGTETTQKIGFWNTTPVAQQAAITRPAGGGTVDDVLRAVVNDMITKGSNIGFWATS